MAGSGAPSIDVGDVNARIAIIASSWHATVMDGLIAGAQRVCDAAGVQTTLVRVPGSFELPLAAQVACQSGYDGVIALGVIIRGGTPHFEFVSDAATSGLLRVSLDEGKPIGFGVLTTDDDEQALDRSGLPGSREDKGAEAAQAVLATLGVLRSIAAPSGAIGFGA